MLQKSYPAACMQIYKPTIMSEKVKITLPREAALQEITTYKVNFINTISQNYIDTNRITNNLKASDDIIQV